MSQNCAVCGIPSKSKCSGCKEITYCSKLHQKEHWKIHKENCGPVKVEFDPKIGRCIIAKRDISVNEIILIEAPLVIGPQFVSSDSNDSICLGCHKGLNKAELEITQRCPRCLWPACDPQCKGLTDINTHGLECFILSHGRIQVFQQENFRYEIITPLRCLLLQRDPCKWSTLNKMEAHMEKRGKNSEVYKEVEGHVKYLHENFFKHMKADVVKLNNKELIHRICGIIDVNSLDIQSESSELSGLYETFSFTEHSCLPNVKISFNKNKVVVRAACNIKRGEHIKTSYTNVLWGTQARQDHLLKTKYFKCNCERCADPKELGTNFTSLKCLGMDLGNTKVGSGQCGGFITCEFPLNDDSLWKCSNCVATMTSEEVKSVIDGLLHEIEPKIKNPNLKQLQDLLDKLLQLLHPNHYHCFAVKHSLVQMYGHVEGYTHRQLPDDVLQRKIWYCRELLWIARKLDPYTSRIPLYIYVLHHELAAGLIEDIARKKIKRENTSELKNEAHLLLDDAINFLNCKSSSSVESKLQMCCIKLFNEL